MKISIGFVAFGAAMAAASLASAAGTSFGTATTNSGVGTVSGALDASGNVAAVLGAETLFGTFADQNRASGAFNTHNVSGLPIGGTMRAAMRPTASSGGTSADWDSYLRVRNSANTATLATNDDDGPGAMSAMLSGISVPADGNALVQITGYSDRNTYTGADTSNFGVYDLDIFVASIVTPRQYGINTQWWRFDSLPAGGTLEASVINATGTFTDSYLGVFDSSGNMIFANDDGAVGLFSEVVAGDNVLIPGDGILYFAVTSYQGTLGQELLTSTYANENNNTKTGTFDLVVIPAPGSLALLGLGGLVATRRRR